MIKIEKNGRGTWTEHLRLITPALVLVFGVVGWFGQDKISSIEKSVTRMETRIDAIDEKIFSHLTNDEMHMPRSLGVTKAEFLVYQTMRDRQMSDIKEAVCDVRKFLEKIYGNKTAD